MSVPYSHQLEKVESYLETAPQEWQTLLWEIHEFILASDTRIQPWYKYRLPFYGIDENICFVNLKADRSCIDVGFMYGPRLEKDYEDAGRLLSSKELKMIRHYKIFLGQWEEQQQEELAYLIDLAIPYSVKG